MSNWLIYKHVSDDSGKVYVGMTKFTMENRWASHCYEVDSGSNTHFHRAIRLYGKHRWSHEVIVENISTIGEAKALEIYYIKLLDTFENGYNSTHGGDSGSTRHSDEMHKSAPRYTFIHYSLGKEENISLRDMVEKYPDIEKSNIANVAYGLRPHTLGWESYENVGEEPTEYIDDRDYKTYEFSNKNGDCFTGSIDELVATDEVLSYSTINSVVRGTKVSVRGWHMSRTSAKKNLSGIQRKFINDEGEVFVGTKNELSSIYGLSSGNISSVIKGKRLHHKGWKYVCDLHNPLTDDIYRFSHVSGLHFTGSADELRRYHKCKASRLINGTQKSVSGWSVVEQINTREGKDNGK